MKKKNADSLIKIADQNLFEQEFTYDNLSLYANNKTNRYKFLDSLPALFKEKINPKYIPTPMQVDVIRNCVTTSDNLFIVEGVPGAGKTSGVLKWVIGFIKGGEKPHTKIYVSAPNEGGMKAVNGDFGSDHPEIVQILTFDEMMRSTELEEDAFVIIDECYMMNRTQLLSLIEKATQKNWRVLLTGDSKQNLPTDNIFAVLDGFSVFSLTDSFRAKREEERRFVSIYSEQSLKDALRFLYHYKDDVIGKLGTAKNHLIELQNIFASFESNERGEDTHIPAAANWVEYFWKKYEQNTDSNRGSFAAEVMIVAHEDDKPQMRQALLDKHIPEPEIDKIIKTSAESQGAGAKHVALVLNKKLTQSAIYVGLSRQKEDALIFISIGNKQSQFETPEKAIQFDYKSDQKKALNRQRWKKAIIWAATKRKHEIMFEKSLKAIHQPSSDSEQSHPQLRRSHSNTEDNNEPVVPGPPHISQTKKALSTPPNY